MSAVRRQWAWLGLGLSLRLAFALKLGSAFYQFDETGFHAAASLVANYGLFGPKTAMAFPPIPVLFFAAFLRLGGDHLLWPRLAEAFLGTAAAWAVGRLAARLSRSEAAAELALAVSCVYPFFIYYGGMVMSEIPYIAVLVPALILLSRAFGDGGRDPRLAAAAGAALGLAALCRPEAAPIGALIWAFAALLAGLKRWSWKGLALAVCLWALPLALWAARDRVSFGQWTLDDHGGMAMMHGTVLFDYNEQDTSVAMRALEKMPVWQEAQKLPPTARDRLFLRTSLEFMRDNPRTVLRQWARKLVNFWRLYPRTDKVYVKSDYSHPTVGLGRDALVVVSLLFEPWLLVLGFLGLVEITKDRALEAAPLWLFLAGTTAIHMVSVSQMRYRLPVMPLFIAGAGAWIAARLQSVKR